MVHLIMHISPNHMMYLHTEILLRSLEVFGNVKNYYCTCIINSGSPFKVPSFLEQRMDVIHVQADWRADDYTSGYKRWLVEPKGEVCVLIDVDMLVCGELQPIIQLCKNAKNFCGVRGYGSPFPDDEQGSSRQTWARFFKHLNIEYSGPYSSGHSPAQYPLQYFNEGLLLIPAEYLNKIGHERNEILRCIHSIKQNYFNPQVATSMALIKLAIPYDLLPMRWNFPLIPGYYEEFNKEFNNIKIFHMVEAKRYLYEIGCLANLSWLGNFKSLEGKFNTIYRMISKVKYL